MDDTETASWMAALERARAELESALAADPHWQALRGAGAEQSRAEGERALAGNPVYRCWTQIDGAIEELRHKAQFEARTKPAPARRRIALRDILERIRSDPGPSEAGPQAAASEPERTEPAGLAEPAQEPADRVPVAPEEATVSFVIREPARPPPAAGRSDAPSGANEPARPGPAEPDADLGVEAEVIIVPRQR